MYSNIKPINQDVYSNTSVYSNIKPIKPFNIQWCTDYTSVFTVRISFSALVPTIGWNYFQLIILVFLNSKILQFNSRTRITIWKLWSTKHEIFLHLCIKAQNHIPDRACFLPVNFLIIVKCAVIWFDNWIFCNKR